MSEPRFTVRPLDVQTGAYWDPVGPYFERGGKVVKVRFDREHQPVRYRVTVKMKGLVPEQRYTTQECSHFEQHGDFFEMWDAGLMHGEGEPQPWHCRMNVRAIHVSEIVEYRVEAIPGDKDAQVEVGPEQKVTFTPGTDPQKFNVGGQDPRVSEPQDHAGLYAAGKVQGREEVLAIVEKYRVREEKLRQHFVQSMSMGEQRTSSYVLDVLAAVIAKIEVLR